MSSKLPKPDEYGRYRLPDGSIVYSSGKDYYREGVPVKMPSAGTFMLWVCTGQEFGPDGIKRNVGEFVLTRDDIKRYHTPAEAVDELAERRRHG